MSMKLVKLALCAVFLGTMQSIAQMQSLRPSDTFAGAKLSTKEAREIIGAVELSAYDTPDSWKKELRVRRVDLGGYKGLVVQGSNLLCGGTGNCQIWIFRKAGDRWVSMFGSDSAPIAESFQLESSTQGVKDLTIVTNSSAEGGERAVYRFDGQLYRKK